jgi:hypothetical protein
MLIQTCHAHGVLCRDLEKLLSEWHGRDMARVWHGTCESNMAALCKSNGKDTIYTLSGTAWQGNDVGAAWERHGMCEIALSLRMNVFLVNSVFETFTEDYEAVLVFGHAH